MRGYVQKRLHLEPLDLYYPVVQWDTLRLILILQCILCLQSQIIDLKNAFDQEDIPSGDPFFIRITRYFKSDGEQCDMVIRLKKRLYCQDEDARLWYKKLKMVC